MPQFNESSLVKWMGEDTGELILGANEIGLNIIVGNIITDEVIANYNVLRFLSR
jgi:hypothetical protein